MVKSFRNKKCVVKKFQKIGSSVFPPSFLYLSSIILPNIS